MTFLTNAKGEPLLLLGTQTHNSSVGDPEMMARELAAVKGLRRQPAGSAHLLV